MVYGCEASDRVGIGGFCMAVSGKNIGSGFSLNILSAALHSKSKKERMVEDCKGQCLKGMVCKVHIDCGFCCFNLPSLTMSKRARLD